MRPDRPLTRSIGPDAAWLREDLLTLADGIDSLDVDAFTLRHEIAEESHSRNILRSIREIAQTEAQVVFCTHAMLALAQKTKWRVMPAPTLLVIDEAHQFEAAVSLVNSSRISLYTLRALLARARREQKLSAHSAVAQAHGKVTDLGRYLGGLGQDETIGMEDLSQDARNALLAKCEAVRKSLDSKPCAALPMVRSYARAFSMVMDRLRALQSPGSARERPGEEAYVSYSNIRRSPSFIAGPASVSGHLGAIWSSAKAGVVLASATLYTPTSTGDLRCDYLRTILNTPQGRTVMAMPVVDPSIYAIPTMHIPTPATAAALRPAAEAADRHQWHQEQARVLVEHVLPSSQGGTLVLCTSYADIEGLAEQLHARGLERSIISMSRGSGFSLSRNAFIKAYQEGGKPVLLALGPAWTGVDLSLPGVPPEVDRLLTALVVSKLPVGLNDSNTMRARKLRMGMHAVTQEALLTLKQGFGRLIRRSGVQDRHLWLLDGRVYDGQPWSQKNGKPYDMRELTAATRRIVKTYQRVVEF